MDQVVRATKKVSRVLRTGRALYDRAKSALENVSSLCRVSTKVLRSEMVRQVPVQVSNGRVERGTGTEDDLTRISAYKAGGLRYHTTSLQVILVTDPSRDFASRILLVAVRSNSCRVTRLSVKRFTRESNKQWHCVGSTL